MKDIRREDPPIQIVKNYTNTTRTPDIEKFATLSAKWKVSYDSKK